MVAGVCSGMGRSLLHLSSLPVPACTNGLVPQRGLPRPGRAALHAKTTTHINNDLLADTAGHQGKSVQASHMQEYLTAGRNWQAIDAFYAAVVRGERPLSSFKSPEEMVQQSWWQGQALYGQDLRITYKVTLAYFGPAFSGWARQPGLCTVEGTLQAALQPLLPPGTPPLVLSVAGRTDKGVSAIKQVVSFFSWLPLDLPAVCAAIDAAGGPDRALRVVSCERQPRSFHATYSATRRRYVYLLPLRPKPCADVNVELADTMLRRLEGRTLDYTSFARDTPFGKNSKCTLYHACASIVVLPVASSTHAGQEAQLLGSTDALNRDAQEVQAMCVELEGDRFMRRMVRVLVATVAREASSHAAIRSGLPLNHGGVDVLEPMLPSALRENPRFGPSTAVNVHDKAERSSTNSGRETSSLGALAVTDCQPEPCEDRLLDYTASGDRQATGPPAPAEGLMFAGVVYD